MSYKIEMHAHTSQSSPCGQISAEDLVRRYAEAGYAGIVITDHFRLGTSILPQDCPEVQLQKFLAGYRAAALEGARVGVKVYLGVEMFFEQSVQQEFLLYGVTEKFLGECLSYIPGSLENFYPFAHKNGVLVFCAHPYRMCPPDPAFIDGVESYNLKPGVYLYNECAVQFAVENNLLQVSGSDAHHESHVAYGGIVTDVLPDDIFALRDLLLSGNYTLITGAEE